jgi:hypothetical protein
MLKVSNYLFIITKISPSKMLRPGMILRLPLTSSAPACTWSILFVERVILMRTACRSPDTSTSITNVYIFGSY